MRTYLSNILVLSFALGALGACAGEKHAAAPQPPAASAPRTGLQIKLVTVYVDDQDKALAFYTDVLGFAKKDDFSNSGYRWLTVTDGANELQLALDGTPAAKAYQEAQRAQNQPAVMFYTSDIGAEYERIKAKGGTFSMPPTDVTMSTIAMLEDGVGNLIQLTELKR